MEFDIPDDDDAILKDKEIELSYSENKILKHKQGRLLIGTV